MTLHIVHIQRFGYLKNATYLACSENAHAKTFETSPHNHDVISTQARVIRMLRLRASYIKWGLILKLFT